MIITSTPIIQSAHPKFEGGNIRELWKVSRYQVL